MKTKSFVQYQDDDVRIKVKIFSNGTFSNKSCILSNTYSRNYYKNNLEKMRKRGREWSRNNPESGKKWARNNPEKHLEYGKKWREDNLEKARKSGREWARNNPESAKEWARNNPENVKKRRKTWIKNHPEHAKKIIRNADKRHQSKRKRLLGYNTLNEHFEGSIGHHINHDDVVFIPASLHRPISHDGNTREGMIEINKAVLNWIYKKELF